MQPDQKDERRKHPRIAVETKGRFLAPDGSEHQCSLRDISIGGIAVSSPVSLFEGAQIIIYLDDFGRFEGKIVRVFEGGFAIETAISGPRRERLQQRLDALARGESSVLTVADGTTLPCRIIDMSLGGAQVAIDPRPPIGTTVSIGRMAGRIVRHTDEGVGIQFTNIPEHSNALSRPFG